MAGKGYFAYVRVSTQRQGNLGTSLAEQQSAIENYSQRFGLRIIKLFEERETAAKLGRPVFFEMIKALNQGVADGLIVHKIDRSARNLKDWADLGSLIDRGIEVHFANESLDLSSRGGRLSADIQAVVAADYIRNLREETKKGIYGRLRQGLYPFPARVGYLDAGKGKPKEVDPVQGPLVRQAFELYASGETGLDPLVEKMFGLGLRNKSGRKVSRNGLACILKNPFYMGIIKVDTIGELFVGVHEPLVSREIFDRVQEVFQGKTAVKKSKHNFPFRRLVNCALCRNFLIAETKKGYVYYRCQRKVCPQRSIRQELIEEALLDVYQALVPGPEEVQELEEEARLYVSQENRDSSAEKKSLQMELPEIDLRLARLADAYIDGVFSKDTYAAKQNELVLRQEEIKNKLVGIDGVNQENMEAFNAFLGQLKVAYISFKLGSNAERRQLVQMSVSDCRAEGKSLSIKLKTAFQEVLDNKACPIGSPRRAGNRTKALVKKLFQELRDQPIPKRLTKSDTELPLAP